MKNKKLISVVAMSVLFSTSSLPANMWDSGSILNNRTKSAVATDSNTGISYLSGGGFEVRFKGGNSFPPVLALGAPSFNASCSGISFDAGYAAFMNLEKLGKQLSQSGASVAYGVLLGLVYSMPGIEQAFNRVNEWSEWLQSLMNDSCKIGTNIGKRMSSGLWENLEGTKTSINNAIPSPSDVLEKSPNWKTSLDFIYGDGTEDDKKSTNNILLESLIGDAKGGLVASYLNTLNARFVENIAFSEEALETKKLSELNLSPSTQMMVYFILSLIDDVSMSEAELKTIVNAINTKDSGILSKILDEKKDGNTFKRRNSSQKSSPKAIVSFLLNGVDDSTLADMKEPKFFLVQNTDPKGSKEQFILLSNETSLTAATVFTGWEGFVPESKKLLVYLYNNIGMKFKKNNNMANSVPLATVKTKLADPRVIELINRMVISKSSSNSVTIGAQGEIVGADEEVVQILNYLAYQNALQHTNTAIENLEITINSKTTRLGKKDANGAIDTTKVPTAIPNDAIKDLENVKKQVMEATKTMKVELDKYYKQMIRNKSVTEMLDKYKESIVTKTITKGGR